MILKHDAYKMITSNIIGFQLSAFSGKEIFSFDPALQVVLPEGFSVATTEEVNLAMQKANAAWPVYRNLPGKARATFLRTIADGIEGLGAELIHRIRLETAYPEARIIVERNRTCMQLRMFAEVAENETWREITTDEALPNRTPAPRPELKRMMIPLGPVVVFGASNFPLAYSTAGGDVASALAVGCPVVVKAHDSHLGTNALVAEVIMQAAKTTGMPDGVFSSLNGNGFETGKLLVQHEFTSAVGFTGSLAGGRALFDLGHQRVKPIPVFAEMGSVNPIFILPGALRGEWKEVVIKLVTSMTMTVGQFCTNPGILILQRNEQRDGFFDAIKSELEIIEAQPLLNPGIARSFHKGIQQVQSGGYAHILSNRNAEGQVASPVLAVCDSDVFFAHPSLHHEIFGPYSLIVECSDGDEMRRVANSIEGQLTASIFAGPGESAAVKALTDILMTRVGRIILNGVPTGVEVCAAMTHGGPYPASTDSRFTAVGHYAVRRWIRPVTLQNFDEHTYPDILHD